MNKSKLSALCAKAMGWHTTDTHPMSNKWYYDDEGRPTMPIIDYEPTDDAAQADEVLEYVADGRAWECGRVKNSQFYWCQIGGSGDPDIWEYVPNGTQNLAKILCALRASPEVTDAEINDAMEE